MLGSDEYCRGCKRKAAVVIDHAAKKTSCSECGFDLAENDTVRHGGLTIPLLSNIGLSINTTDPNTASSDDSLSLTLGNSQNRGSDPLSVATTQPNSGSLYNFLPSDLGNSQNRGSDSVSFATTQPSSGSLYDFFSCDLGNSQSRGSDLLSIATTETKNISSDDLLPSDLGNSQNRGSDPVLVDTTEPSNASSDDFLSSDTGNLKKPGFDPLSISTTKSKKASSDDDIVSIASMSERLSLDETVQNRANEIFEKLKGQTTGVKQNARVAACIYIACRQNDMALTIDEISSVANGATRSKITNRIKSIARQLELPCDPLIHIRATEFTKRFCATLEMDSQLAKAAEEAAESFTKYDNGKPPLSVAAVVIYVIARLSYEKKLLKGIIQATGVKETKIEETYKDLYPYLSKITPKWFANEKEVKTLGSP